MKRTGWSWRSGGLGIHQLMKGDAVAGTLFALGCAWHAFIFDSDGNQAADLPIEEGSLEAAQAVALAAVRDRYADMGWT